MMPLEGFRLSVGSDAKRPRVASTRGRSTLTPVNYRTVTVTEPEDGSTCADPSNVTSYVC